MSDLYETLQAKHPGDFLDSPLPDGYFVDENNCLMPIPDKSNDSDLLLWVAAGHAFECPFCDLKQCDISIGADVCKCELSCNACGADVWHLEYDDNNGLCCDCFSDGVLL